MSLSEYLLSIKKEKQTSLYMPYITLGDPDFHDSFTIIKTLIDAGAHILELGIPFSDPTADGPIIQRAMVRSMNQPGFSLEKIFELTQKIHEYKQDLPLVYLTYFNPVFRYKQKQNTATGEQFLKTAAETGIKALVIPDLPLDSPEARSLQETIQKFHLDIALIPMIAPNTGNKRIRTILAGGSGFIYYITSLGVTGLRDTFSSELESRIQYIRSISSLPVFAGFGISKIEHALQLKTLFDGIIVGSLNHKIIEESLETGGIAPALAKLHDITSGFLRNLKLEVQHARKE